MTIINNSTRTLAPCIEALRGAIGPGIKVALAGPDLELRFGAEPPTRLTLEAARRVATKTQALHLILQLQRRKAGKGGAIVLAEWIPPLAAEEFRKAGIFFADLQGNVYLRKPPQFVIDIRGRKPPHPVKAEPGRLIEPGGLKVVHYLLARPQALNQPLRAIAQNAGVALGTVHAVVRELERAGWLLPAAGGKRRLADRTALLDLFVRGYALKLRPACLLGRFRHRKTDPQQILEAVAQRLAGLEGRWAVTGGMAARQMTHHLEPDAVALFVDEQARAKLAEGDLLRDETNGNVTLLALFAPTVLAAEPTQEPPLATPLLVYAELLENGGAREVETAGMIYEKFIEPQAGHGT